MSDITQTKNNFKNQALFEQALTHRSWLNEHSDAAGNNERLEFLGDAVLEFAVSSRIYEQFPDKEEGFLTALRANIVNTENLAAAAKRINLGKELRLSKGEENGGGRDNASLLADTLEAIIGAIYIDQGYENARIFVNELLLENIEEKLSLPLKDFKSRLQETVQANGSSTPKYSIVKEEGPDHNKQFVVQVHVDDKPIAEGVGSSKSRAEQAAAEAALSTIGTDL